MIVHIGFHKTATTWLQNSIFPFIKDVNYLGISSLINNTEAWVSEFRRELPQKINLEKIRKEISIAERKSILLLSDERFSGGMLTGAGAIDYADRISNVSSDPKVIICIRNQVDMWESIYRQYVNEGGDKSFNNFFKEEGLGSDFFYLGNLEYSNLISYYFEKLGRSNVLVLAYEELLNDKREFLGKILNFIESKDNGIYAISNQKVDNKSIGYYETILLRFLNPFMKTGISPGPVYFPDSRYLKWLLRKIPIKSKKKFTDVYLSEIETRYSADNERLKKIIPELDIEKYGYVCNEGTE